MTTHIFYEDLFPEFNGSNAEFEALIYAYKNELSEWKKSKPVPKYDVIEKLIDNADFELVYKKDYYKGDR